MTKKGFIIKVKSKGREYFYLRRSVWKNKVSRPENIFSFGSKEKALHKISLWKNNTDSFPEELKKMGFGEEDISLWLEQIENK